MVSAPDSVTYQQSVSEQVGASEVADWLSTFRPANPWTGMIGYATDLDTFEFRIASAWRHPAWIEGAEFVGPVNFGPTDYQRVQIFPSGMNTDTNGSPQTMRVRRVGSDNTAGVAYDNLWVTRSSWVLTNATAPAGTRFNAVFDSSGGAGVDPGAVWNVLHTHTTSASEDSLSAVTSYTQMVRAGVPGGGKKGVQAEAMVVEARDASGASSATGGLMRTLELDLFCNGADDYAGAVGREVMPILLGKSASAGASPTITSLIGVYPVIGDGVSLTRGITFANQLSFTQSLWDTRDSVQGASANAIWLKSGHRIAFDGDSTGLNTPSTNFLSHSSSAIRASGTFVAANTGAAPITLASGSISVPASQSLAIQLLTAGQSINLGASGAGLGHVLSVTPNSNGNSAFGALPNNVLVSNRLTASQIFSPATTYTLSGTVSPTSITGNGATVTVTFPAIAGIIIPVGSTVTTTGFTPSGYNETDKVVVTSTSTTLTYASTATGTMTVAGSMAYKMTPPDLIRFASNWAGEAAAVGAAFSPYEFTIPSDTALTDGTGHGAAVMNVAHNWSGTATGGKLGIQVSLAHTGATNDTGSQQHVVANMHAQSSFNAGGTGTGVLSHGTFYGLNPQVRLGYGATYWRLANTLGEIDLAVNATQQNITLGGTVTAGDAVTLTFASADIVGTPVAVSYTVGASQTLAMVANNLAAAVNNNTALRNARIGATSWEGSLKIYYYTHIATLTITPSTSGGATITAVKGTLTTGASVDFKTMATFIRLQDDDAPGSSGSALMVFGSSLSPSPSGQFEMGIAFNGHPAYHGSWSFSPSSTLIGSNLTTAVGFLDKSSPIPSNMSRYGVDWQYVNFTQATAGRAFRSSNFAVGGEGNLYSGGAVISPTSTGLSVDLTGRVASSVALASGGGGGAGQVIGNYFLGDIGFDDYNGQYLVTGVNAGTGAVTTFTVLSPPSYPSGAAPANPITVNGGSGRNWTVNATWPGTASLQLQPSGGATVLGGGMSWNVGGSFAAGNLARDSNWGLWLQGASGATADVALAASGGTAAVKIPSSAIVQMDKGVYAGGGAANTWSGTSLLPPNLAFASIRTFNGTLPVGQSSDNGAHLNWVKATDNMLVGTSGVSAISHFAVNGTMGATATGNRVAHNVTLALTTLTANAAAGKDPNYNAGSYYVYSTANQGGTAQTVAGANSSLFGDIKIVRTGSAATYFRDLVGIEIDMISETASGTAPLRKVGIQVVGYNDGTLVDTSQGAFIDAGLLFTQSTTGSVPGWRHGILFGQNNSGLGLSSTGTALMFQAKAPSGSVPTLNTTGYGVDGLQATWASAFLRSKQFSVGADGTVQVYSGYVAPTANGISIASSGRVGTAEAGTLAMGGTSTGGTGWVSNEMVFDTQGLGFVGYVSGVSAGAVTQITVLRQAIKNGAAPTNPVALTGRAGSLGAGLAADMTWTVKSELSLQPTAGQTILMSALQASTTYANDAAAAAGGVAVGQLYRNGSVVQIRIV